MLNNQPWLRTEMVERYQILAEACGVDTLRGTVLTSFRAWATITMEPFLDHALKLANLTQRRGSVTVQHT